MNIQKDCVVSFHYRLQNDQGELIEDSHDGDPNLYLHGHGNVMIGLEQALAGKQAGDSFQVTLEPHLAYGIRQPDKQQRVPIKYLKHENRNDPAAAIGSFQG